MTICLILGLILVSSHTYADSGRIISYIPSLAVGPGVSNILLYKNENIVNKATKSEIKISTISTASIVGNVYNNQSVISNYIDATKSKIGPASEIYIHDGITYMKGTDLGRFKLSGYCACEKCGTGTGLTYSGKKVRANHTVAADLSVLPLGTFVILEGLEEGDTHNYDGVYQVEDKGGGVKGNHLDIYQTTHDLASLVTYYGRAWGHVWLAVPINNT